MFILLYRLTISNSSKSIEIEQEQREKNLHDTKNMCDFSTEVGITNFFLSPLIATPQIFFCPLNDNPLIFREWRSANR